MPGTPTQPCGLPIGRLPDDVGGLVLAFLRGGAWQPVCRCVCRAWARPALWAPACPPPYSPYEAAYRLQDRSLVAWLRRCRVPWSVRALYGTARTGRLGDVEWALCLAGKGGPLPPRAAIKLRLTERVQLTKAVVQAGPRSLHLALEWQRQRRDTRTANLLLWTADMLAYIVEVLGATTPWEVWPAVWATALDLCGGWSPEALSAAVLRTPLPIVRAVAADPRAADVSNDRWQAVWQAAVHRMPSADNVALYDLLVDLAKIPVRWDLFVEAVQWHNHTFQEWFLCQSPRNSAPSLEEVRHCALAAVSGPPRSLDSMRSLQRLRDRGLLAGGLSIEVAVCGMKSHSIEVLDFLLDHLQAQPGDAERLFLCAAGGGRLDVVERLEARFPGGLQRHDPTLMACAAEFGHVAMLEWLLQRGCVADHRVLQFALMNNHLIAARWALEHPADCPLYAGVARDPARPSNEDILRAWVLSQLAD